MTDWLLPDKHALIILKKDHAVVKSLFLQFERTLSLDEKRRIVAETLENLKIHATLEEEIFYPAVRAQVGDDLMNEAVEEHHVAKLLIAELDNVTGPDEHQEAKFSVLAGIVRHHIEEEEDQMMPRAKGLEIDFEQLGQRMLNRRKQLLRVGVPTDMEHTMIAAAVKQSNSRASIRRKKTQTERKAA